MTIGEDGIIVKVSKEIVNNQVVNTTTERLDKDAIKELFPCTECKKVGGSQLAFK